ncbi:TPA: triK protein [Escherichia coli]
MDFDGISFLKWVYENAYPGMTFLSIFILAVLIQFTFSGHVTKRDNLSAFDHIVSFLKTKLLVAYVALFILFNLFVLMLSFQQFGKDKGIEYLLMIYNNIKIQSFNFSSMLSIVTIFILPYFFQITYRRLIAPKLSSLKRKYRVSQTGDNLSDIRVENDRFQSKQFNPRDYYKDGFMFMGLDGNDLPIYLSDDEFKTKNTKVIGATQTGKGVWQQVIIDQCIKKGWGVWFFDQKPDDFIYSVMVQACKDWNRELPTVVDLTGESGLGYYAPFQGGSTRERLERFYKAFGLNEGGTDSDHYKNMNKEVMTFISDYWDGTLTHLEKLLTGKDKAIPDEKRDWVRDASSNIRTKLTIWKMLPNLFPKKGEGFNVSSAIDNGDIVYVRARQDDDLIRQITTTLLVEWKDYVIKSNPKIHQFCMLDEARFIMSDNVANGLATVLSKNANMGLAYQERDDLQKNPDKTANGEAIQKSAETNTLITIVYKCSFETAKWIADESGTKPITITKLEQVETDGFGSEKWGGNRMIGQEEENYITTNSIRSLKKRVGVLDTSEGLMQYLFTCWIPLKEKVELPVKSEKQKEEIHSEEAGKSQEKSTKPSGNEGKEIVKMDSFDSNVPAFNPEDDPDFMRMLEASFSDQEIEYIEPAYVNDVEPVVQKPTQSKNESKKPSDVSDLISSIGKNED